MTEVHDSGKAAFEPRARLLKLIGEELISSEVVAVTELVKNSHDADATKVEVEFRGTTSTDGEIIVRDDGTGMSLDELLDGWMQPASSMKRREPITPRGRRVLGEKGVGRFAADKIASRLDLASREPGVATEIHAEFMWDEFDREERMLSEVENSWEVRDAETLDSHGTILRMRGLRKRWTERRFRRVCTRLSRLVSPFRQAGDDFSIVVVSDEFPEYSGELSIDYIDRAPYRIHAEFDGDFNITVTLDGEDVSVHPWNGITDLRCGPVEIQAFAFDLEPESLARVGPRMEVRRWLREWSGISVYRDGFRVWPYGEPDDDWLRLDQRRVNNPVVRLSNNQVVGFVEISRDRNPDLVDQTNREGLVKNRAFEDLRRLIHFVLKLLEAHRQTLRHPRDRKSRSEPADGRRDGKSLRQRIQKLADKLDDEPRHELERIAEQVAAAATREKVLMREYAELAALGSTAEQTHALLAPGVRELARAIDELCGEVDGRKLPALKRKLRGVDDMVEPLSRRLALLSATDGRVSGRRRRTIDVVTELEELSGELEPLIADRDAKLKILTSGEKIPRCEMTPSNFARLAGIVITNSLDWMELSDRRLIRIRARTADEGELVELIFSDTGPGIPPDVASRAFDPGYSTREGGRGMGLTIARDIVLDHGGEIEILQDGRRVGANVQVLLPRKRPKATRRQPR